MPVLLAAAPLLAVLAALLLRQSALRASILGVAVAAVIAVAAFDTTPGELAVATWAWWPLGLEVLAIVAGGLAFAEAGRRSGGQRVLSDWLRRSLGTGVAPVLAIVHGVTPLAESLTGFGVGAAIAVPLLAALGLDGRRAAVIGLLGLCAVPWGSMAPGTLIAAQLSGLGFEELGVASAMASLPVFLGVGIAAALLTVRAGEPGRAPRGRLGAVAAAIASGLALWGGVLGANLLIGTPPAGALGALAALLLHLLVGALRGRRAGLPRAVRRAAMPYLLLIGGVVAAMLVVRATGQFETAWRALASPAVWLVVATVATATVTTGIGATDIGATGTVTKGTAATASTGPRLLRAMLPDVAARWWRVGPATALFLVFGVVMAVSGMSQTLALALAGLGGAYLVAVPAIGALGGFMTGSNSGANAMFAAPQAQAVTAIGADLLPAMAVHNVAAALFMMASPARVELAVQLTSDRPRAAVVQRTVLVVDLAILAVLTGGLLVLLLPTL